MQRMPGEYKIICEEEFPIKIIEEYDEEMSGY
jgi:hypothetical protein